MNVMEELSGLREGALKYKNIMYQIHDDEYNCVVTAEMEKFHADFVNRIFKLSERMDEIEKCLLEEMSVSAGVLYFRDFLKMLRGEE